MTQIPRDSPYDSGFRIIGVYKLVKAALLLALAVGLTRLFQQDVGTTLERWIVELRLDPENRLVRALLERAAKINPKHILAIEAGTFASALFVTVEGVGLLLRQRWAGYLTVIATALLLPLEVYEILHRLTAVRVGVFVVNLVIVGYLVFELRRSRSQLEHRPGNGSKENGLRHWVGQRYSRA